MKTLIELYDDSPVENVLSTEMFRPEETIFICPNEVADNKQLRESLIRYFEHRNVQVRLTFVPVSMLDATKVEKTLRTVLDSHEDCAIDISGGTDAALYAAGAVSREVQVFTYSRKKNTFFSIVNAPYADHVKCGIHLDTRSCFLMAGGSMMPGRGDSAELAGRIRQIGRLFEIFCVHRRIWNRQISYYQKISQGADPERRAYGRRTTRADHGQVTADDFLLTDLKASGFIRDVETSRDRVSFVFADDTVRFWLRDVGAVLELQVYRACMEAGCFDDVTISAVVNWQGGSIRADSVVNEIDVVAVRQTTPLFISCKTCEIRTEALNELAILRDRFGGKNSRAMIVTSAPATKGRLAMRNRAAELGIEVVEWEDLPLERLVNRLKKESGFPGRRGI